MSSTDHAASPSEDSPGAQVTTTDVPASLELREGDVVNNRYRVLRKLGHGGMGAVHLVQDAWKEDRLLALKRVRKDRLDARTISILRNEFLALAPLHHPNLAQVYDFEVDLQTQDYFFTSEYVDGAQLLRAARDFRICREKDFHRLLDFLVQTLRALEFIHSRGLVHGDIKPENILICGSLCEYRDEKSRIVEPPPIVKMIDFGLTKREKEFGGKRIVGTTYYIAPETILGSQVDRRTDLYSLGVVLYHMATRKLPFTGDNNLTVLRGHIEKPPNPPSAVDPAIPEPLNRIILKLLEKQPVNRYGSALEVLDAVNAAFHTDFPIETPESRLSYIRSTSFIARENEMSELGALFESVYRLERAPEMDEELNLPADVQMPTTASVDQPPPPGRMILIRGESGIGKRRILSEFRRFVQTRGVHYIEVNCGASGNGARRGFGELIQAQVGVLSARVPEEAPDPARLVEFISRIEKDIVMPFSMRPAVEKIARKFHMLCRITPLVLSFIDLHRADAVLLEFLKALLERIASGKVQDAQIMVVATAEDEESDESRLRPFFSASKLISLMREVHLPRLSLEEVGRMVTSMFGDGGDGGVAALAERLARIAHHESDGNPGMVVEILEGLASANRLVRHSAGWTCEEIPHDSLFVKVRSELKDRVQTLPAAARKLAHALALLDGEGEVEAMYRLAELAPGQHIDALLALRRARIIREESGGEGPSVFRFRHRSAEDVFYEEIPAAERPAQHLRAGLVLEAILKGSGRQDARRLAYHFIRAGNGEAALRYGRAAAQEYAAAYQCRKAIDLYREIRPFVPADQPELSRQIERAVAQLLLHMGEYRAAVEILRVQAGSIAEGAPEPPGKLSPSEEALIRVDLGNALCRLGIFREASNTYHEAFRMIKKGGNAPDLAAVLLGFGDLFYRKGNFAESLRYCERVLGWEKSLKGTSLETRLYLLLADNHFRLDNKEIAVRYCQKGLELLGSERNIDHMALVLFYLGKFYTYKGKFQNALHHLTQCALLNGRISAIDRQADCLREIGGIHLNLDNPVEAQTQLSQAISIYQRTENAVGLVEALNLRGEAHRILGHYDDAQKDLQNVLQINASIGNAANTLDGYLTCARISIDRGQLGPAQRYIDDAEKSREEMLDDRVPLKLLTLRCVTAMHRGEFADALDLAARGLLAGREIGNRMRLGAHLDAVVRLYLALGKPAEARRNLLSLLDIAKRYELPVVEGRAYLLDGMLHFSEGQLEDAGKSFDRSLDLLRDERSERDLIQVYLEYGRLQLSLRNHEQANILCEEGLYLAKKLNIVHAKCRLYHLMGCLEAALPEGVFARAAGYLLSAERYARGGPFPDLLLQIQLDMGRFYLDASRFTNADRAFTAALTLQREVLEKVPEGFRENYIAKIRGRGAPRAKGQEPKLEDLQREVKHLSEAEQRTEAVKYPARVPDSDRYFGLVGGSSVMRNFYQTLAKLPTDAPWLWIWGPPGSGRSETARAIHRQSVPDREALWVFQAEKFQTGEMESFFRELARTRGTEPRGGPPGGSKGTGVPTIPGRYSLIILDAGQLAPQVQKGLLEKAQEESGRADGLRILAILDRLPDQFRNPSVADAGKDAARGGQIVPALLAKGFAAVKVPALAEHVDDIPALVDHFLQSGRRSQQDPLPRFTPEGMDLLKKYHFHEGVRELRELCEKFRRLGGGGPALGPEALRSILSPTLRIVRKR